MPSGPTRRRTVDSLGANETLEVRARIGMSGGPPRRRRRTDETLEGIDMPGESCASWRGTVDPPHGANEAPVVSARIGMPSMLPLKRRTIGPLGANEAQSWASWRRSVGPLGVNEALEVCARIGMPDAPLHR
jgi:hypothetical protein